LRSLAMRGRHALLEEIYCRWRRDDTTPLAANTDTWNLRTSILGTIRGR
jgi:hypothetical protein